MRRADDGGWHEDPISRSRDGSGGPHEPLAPVSVLQHIRPRWSLRSGRRQPGAVCATPSHGPDEARRFSRPESPMLSTSRSRGVEMGSLIVVLVVLLLSGFLFHRVPKQHRDAIAGAKYFRSLQVRDHLEARAPREGSGVIVMKKLLIGAAAAAAIGFAPFTTGAALAAPACSQVPPGNLPPEVLAQITGACLASARAAGVPAAPPPGVVPVLPPQGAPDPQCAQYQLPSDIQRCEDVLHGAQEP